MGDIPKNGVASFEYYPVVLGPLFWVGPCPWALPHTKIPTLLPFASYSFIMSVPTKGPSHALNAREACATWTYL